MRKLLVVLLVVVLVVGGTIVYLFATAPRTARPLRFPLTARQRAFVSLVPSSAESFAFVPSVAVVHDKLLANPVTREPLLEWTSRQPLPGAWILGGADLLVWRTGRNTSYAVRFDRVRAVIARVWTMVAGPHDATWDGPVMLIADPQAAGSSPWDLSLTEGLAEGDALVVQKAGSRGAFPPIGRPSASSVRITANEITLVSRARSTDPTVTTPIRATFPAGAMLSVSFSQPPRVLGDLGRLLGTDLESLVSGGGSIALYDVDAGTLLPRPKGLLLLPADERGRAFLEQYRSVVELAGELREVDGQLAVSFDRTSLSAYINDEKVAGTLPATRWAGRIRPHVLLPILRRLGDNPGLRLAAPRVYRSARDLRNWIGALENAETIEAAETSAGGFEELRVRIQSK
jgi:hypothetical protein